MINNKIIDTIEDRGDEYSAEYRLELLHAIKMHAVELEQGLNGENREKVTKCFRKLHKSNRKRGG